MLSSVLFCSNSYCLSFDCRALSCCYQSIIFHKQLKLYSNWEFFSKGTSPVLCGQCLYWLPWLSLCCYLIIFFFFLHSCLTSFWSHFVAYQTAPLPAQAPNELYWLTPSTANSLVLSCKTISVFWKISFLFKHLRDLAFKSVRWGTLSQHFLKSRSY